MMTSSRAAEVSEALRTRRADYLPRVFPAGKIRGGKFFIGNVQGDPGESLSIPLGRTAPGLRDFGGDFHGDDLDLFAAAMGLSLAAAIKEAERQGYVSRQVRRAYARREDKAHRGREKARAKENDPGNAEDQRHPKFGKPDILYPYFDAAGRPVFYVARWDRTKGERGKEIRPLHWNGRAWDWSDPKGLLPFYNMIEVMAHSDKPVMIHEGENKADRAREELPQYAHAAWAHGSSSVARADWSLLCGRCCIIWPDHDKAGRKAALQVAAALLEAGVASASVVEVPDAFPEKWDLANDLPEGETYADIERLVEQAASIEMPEIRPPKYSDDSLALQLTERHEDELRYLAAWGKWYRWCMDHWEAEGTLGVFDLARAVCRETSAESDKASVAKAITSTATVAAVERMARSDRCHAATVDQWDADPWLLNTPDGVVDLRTGDMREHSREDYMTKITAVAPGGECPQWKRFLERVTAGDESLQDFLQRMTGYALTGSVREHAFFFLYGTGANGKGVFLNTVSGIASAYAFTAPMETFIASRVGAPSNGPRWAPWSPSGDGQRNRRGAPMGREQDQSADWRRHRYRPLHAAGLLPIQTAVQARHRRQSQARPAQRR